MQPFIKINSTFPTLKTHCFAFLLLVFFLASCNTGSNSRPSNIEPQSADSIPAIVTQNDTVDAVVKMILDISSNDFFNNQSPLPIAFRDVQLRYSIKPNREILYILCGEFALKKNQSNVVWTHFTTIKNSDYEQWIGPNGLTYCENSKPLPYTKADLAVELKRKLDALQKK